ncbi:MAG: signal recognition particle-docking protein FtsY [Rickettsiales bacterium]|jgi:fused signal recognition particle receptor|nr:signal recognition particle-docking protein FtsY [Rickettsiales bacterium]
MGLFDKLFGAKKLDAADAEKTSDILISADIAPELALEIAQKLRRTDNPRQTLKESLMKYAERLGAPGAGFEAKSPMTVLIVGVNGSGKTTTIGKLARRFKDAGRDVIIGAGDTFRAAANEQLDIWAARADAEIIHGTNPSSVAYETIEKNRDIAIIDTAGRLHNRRDLMDELEKVVRVIKKKDENAPTDAWLVLDGMTGQNALAQIEHFKQAVPLTGLVVTKTDGTGKGGFLITYAAREKEPLPVVYVGYGEKISDLKPFLPEEYVDKMLDG